jgi:threonine aldolase
LTHCKRGEEVIVGKDAHTVRYEVGGMAAMGGIMPYALPVQADGTFNLDEVRAAIRFPNDHFPNHAPDLP